jgi:hypothetical protein
MTVLEKRIIHAAEQVFLGRARLQPCRKRLEIRLYGHPAAESVRKWKTPEVFSKRLRRLLHRPVWMREHPIKVSG